MTLAKANEQTYGLMKTLISKHASLGLLGAVEDKIVICFQEKASMKGGVPVMGKTSKASKQTHLVSEVEWEFLITLPHDIWVDLSDKEKEALLFHQLCVCGVEENEETGDLKCFIRVPDVSFFKEEVAEYGFWRTSGEAADPNLIADLFGD